jgi:hypothetical protein
MISNEKALQAIQLYLTFGSFKKASKESGIPEEKIRYRVSCALKQGIPNYETCEKVRELRRRNYRKGGKSFMTDSIQKSSPEFKENDRLQQQVNNLKSQIQQIENDPETLLSVDRELIKRKDEIKILKSKLLISEKEVKRLETQNNILTKLSRKPRSDFKIRSTIKKAEAVACMIASDWHVEENVDPEGINHYNSFCVEIAKERANNFFQNGLYLIKKEMQNAKISTVLLGLLGDFISNYIHDELEEDNELSPLQAIEFTEDLVTAGIDFLLDDGCFDKLLIPCCFGNHGRTTKKTRFSTGWKNNYEYMLYRHIQKLYDKNPRVDVIINKGYHNIINIYDYILRLHHGDAI